MHHRSFIHHLRDQLDSLRQQGLYKEERPITSPQDAIVQLANGKSAINLCANNYLGLANNAEVISAARDSYSENGFGTASVRFICGTQTIHQQLEQQLAQFLGMEDAILYSSCFDANGGLFETLLGPEDAVISDSLNHASIIDGIRLCKAKRLRYNHNDMEALEKCLQEAEGCRFKMIATDGVFSMDGVIANLKAICDLAERYGALVMVDDCHATGFLGATGRGSPEYCNVLGRVDILTGTLGKALGGASGGYTAGKREVISWLRQRSRPYLFSNSLAPSIVSASLRVLELVQDAEAMRQTLWRNTAYFRERMSALGFTLLGRDHPIIPILLGDAQLAQQMAAKLLEHNVYVVAFSYPVVPQGQARIRTQMSAAHTLEQLDTAIAAFAAVGRELGIFNSTSATV
jgi:glycine C-acetyltransferase